MTPKGTNPIIDTAQLGLAISCDGPRTKGNPDRKRWLVRFDTGIAMLIPVEMFMIMQFHLAEKDPAPPKRG